MDETSSHDNNGETEAELHSRLLPNAIDFHPYITVMENTSTDIEQGMPAEPGKAKQDQETTDVVGDSGEFAVVPKDGLPTQVTDTAKNMQQEPSVAVSESRNHVELTDMHKVVSSAGCMNVDESRKPSVSAPKKRGLQAMSDRGKHMLGLALVCIHCLTIVASQQTAKLTYQPDFSAPYFLVYFRSCWRVSIFPIFMVLKYIQRSVRNKTGKPTSFMKTFTQCESVLGPRGLTAKSFVWPTGVLAMLWIIVQFAHVFAVKFLNNSIVQALFCSETAFCYILSALILKARVLVIKVAAVSIALGGVAFIVYSQGNDDLSWEGIGICLVGAVLGSLYMVAFKKLIGKSEDVGQALLVTSTMASFITIIGWPFVIILNLTGIEYWDLATFPWGTICISSTLTLVSISLFNLCLTLTSPLIMTLSKLLGIPSNYVVDVLIWAHIIDPYQIIGCVLIGVGFVAIALPESWIAIENIRKLCGKQSVELETAAPDVKPVKNGTVH